MPSSGTALSSFGPSAIPPSEMPSSGELARSIVPSVMLWKPAGKVGSESTSASVSVESGTFASRVPASSVGQLAGGVSGISDRCTPPSAWLRICGVSPMPSSGMPSSGEPASLMPSSGIPSSGALAVFGPAPRVRAPRSMPAIGTDWAPARTFALSCVRLIVAASGPTAFVTVKHCENSDVLPSSSVAVAVTTSPGVTVVPMSVTVQVS